MKGWQWQEYKYKFNYQEWLFTSSDSELHIIPAHFSRRNPETQMLFWEHLESWKWFLLGCWFLRGTVMFTVFHLRWQLSDAAKDCVRRTVKNILEFLSRHPIEPPVQLHVQRHTDTFMQLYGTLRDKTLGNICLCAPSLNIIAFLRPSEMAGSSPCSGAQLFDR